MGNLDYEFYAPTGRGEPNALGASPTEEL